MFTAHWHQEDPGVMPAGDCSGAGAPTGITMYESDALGKQYLGMLLSADAGRNVIFSYHPFIEKSGYNLGKRSNFLTSLSTIMKVMFGMIVRVIHGKKIGSAQVM
jgi:hypothetical protein